MIKILLPAKEEGLSCLDLAISLNLFLLKIVPKKNAENEIYSYFI